MCVQLSGMMKSSSMYMKRSGKQKIHEDSNLGPWIRVHVTCLRAPNPIVIVIVTSTNIATVTSNFFVGVAVERRQKCSNCGTKGRIKKIGPEGPKGAKKSIP